MFSKLCSCFFKGCKACHLPPPKKNGKPCFNGCSKSWLGTNFFAGKAMLLRGIVASGGLFTGQRGALPLQAITLLKINEAFPQPKTQLPTGWLTYRLATTGHSKTDDLTVRLKGKISGVSIRFLVNLKVFRKKIQLWLYNEIMSAWHISIKNPT